MALALLAAPVLLDAGPPQTLRQVVAQRLEPTEVEHPGGRDAGPRAVGDHVAGDVRGELELQAGDLGPQRPTGGQHGVPRRGGDDAAVWFQKHGYLSSPPTLPVK